MKLYAECETIGYAFSPDSVAAEFEDAFRTKRPKTSPAFKIKADMENLG